MVVIQWPDEGDEEKRVLIVLSTYPVWLRDFAKETLFTERKRGFS